MDIIKIFEDISNKFQKEKHASKKKQDILNEIGTLSERVKLYVDLFHSNTDLFKGITASMESNRMDTDKHYIQEYYLFRKRLTRKADVMERDQAFSSVIKTLEAALVVLVDLKDHYDKFINVPEINESNIKISHVEILTMLSVVRGICFYLGYMLAGITKELSKTFSKNSMKVMPKYRLMYINSNTAGMGWIVSKQIDTNVFKDTLTSIIELKKSGKDLFINNTDGHNGELAGNLGVKSNLSLSMVFTENPVLVIGRVYQDIVHWWKIRQLREKEWMETRMSLLRMEAQNYDINSDEYIRLSNIADKYDTLINDIDAKLNDYFTN